MLPAASTDFARFADLLPEPLLLVSSSGQLHCANTAAKRALMLPDELPMLADVVADEPSKLRQYLRLCSRSTEPLPGVLRARGHTGGAADFRCHGWAVKSPGVSGLVLLRLTPKQPAIGRFLALNARIQELSQEISSRLRAEHSERVQRELLRVTLASIGDAVVTTDINGRVTYMNPVAEGLTGHKLEQAQGRPLEKIFVILNEQTGLPAESPVRKVLEHGLIVGLANHTVLVRSDHTTLPIDDSGAPIRDEHGKLLGVVLVFHEVGERRRMEHELRQQAEALKEADRRKDQFLAMLAHELRNPLAPLRNCAELLRLGEPTQAHHAAIAGMLERQTSHLTRLVDDLLDISRITRGTIRLQREPIVLATVIEQAIETLKSYVEQRGHQLHLRPPPKEVVVYGDATRLTQVFCNILSNAAKFMEPRGQIFISGEVAGSNVVVRVRDFGEGLSPELIPSIFDLFVQGHVELDRSQTGLGIGLTLVKTLVEMHGGSVTATSDGLGKGSEFAVQLPIANSTQVETLADVPTPARIEKKILVVDDNVDAAESMAVLLRTWGCDVSVVNSGASAIDSVRSALPDVVLLDIGMPGMDGFEVARRMRRLPKGNSILVIAVTGYGSDLDRKRSTEAGIDVHLSKPVDYKTLRQLLSER